MSSKNHITQSNQKANKTHNKEGAKMNTPRSRNTITTIIVALVLMLVSTASTWAAGTTPADGPINNTATVNYKVGGADQPEETGSVEFEVDIVIKPVVTVDGGGNLDVAPGQTNAQLTYTLTNSGNQIQDFTIDFDQRGDDTDDVASFDVYIDNGTTPGSLDAGDTQISASGSTTAGQYAESLGIDATIKIFVVSTIDGGMTEGQIAAIDIMATARDADGTADNAAGALAAEEGSPAIDSSDQVFGDADGPYDDGGGGAQDADTDEDGQHSATGTYTLRTVDITVTKTVTVADNGLDLNSDDQFYIPGATLTYTITVAYDGVSTATATDIVVTDDIPDNTTFSGLGTVQINGVAHGGAATFADPTLTVTLPARAGDAADDVITFQVTID